MPGPFARPSENDRPKMIARPRRYPMAEATEAARLRESRVRLGNAGEADRHPPSNPVAPTKRSSVRLMRRKSSPTPDIRSLAKPASQFGPQLPMSTGPNPRRETFLGRRPTKNGHCQGPKCIAPEAIGPIQLSPQPSTAAGSGTAAPSFGGLLRRPVWEPAELQISLPLRLGRIS